MSQEDKAYERTLSGDPKKSMRKGFFWIGLASVIYQGLDAITLLIVMLFITKSELGLATLAVSVAIFIDAFNGLGTGTAFLQDNKLTRSETDSVFWFSSLFGVLLFFLLIPLAWPLASFYDNATLIPLFLVSLVRVPFMSASTVPFQLINRRLEFHKISNINTILTVFASVIKIALAALGYGAWALVIANTAFGFGTLVAAFVASGYRPKLHFSWTECRRFVVYGVKHCAGSSIEQLNKTLHYFIVGKYLGEGSLGVYRIVYEIAMTPALAFFNVVNRSSFPVFARLKDDRPQLSQLFAWGQRNIALFAAIPIIFIFFTIEDIFGLINNPDWMGGIVLVPYVLSVSFLRAVMQTFPELYRACGRPTYPIMTAALEATLMFVGFTLTLTYVGSEWGLRMMHVTWLVLFIPLFSLHSRLAKKFIDITLFGMVQSALPAIGFALISSALSFLPWYFRASLPYSALTHMAVEAVLMLGCVWLYVRLVLKVSPLQLLKKKKVASE